MVDGLEVAPGAMAANLGDLGGALLSERLVLAVTAITGDLDTARAAVEQAARAAPSDFAAALAADPVIGGVLRPLTHRRSARSRRLPRRHPDVD